MNQPKSHKDYKPPGLLRHGVNPEVIMMVCTAGHVDHGKTALVRLLTGCNTDRLKIEQERGLTIELGFAPCYLGNNLCVGIVDVPGHERFIKNMVAGVSGIEMAILVIAADDGIMPQTVEHLQIMELLGVRRGMVALTKIDLVSREQVERRMQEIGEFLVDTFLEGANICPVSSETLEGYDHFYHTLVDSIKKITVARRRGVFRMPVERTFSRAGFGLVVSGLPVDGAIQVGDEVEAVPAHVRGRVRGIQCFLRDATEGGYGQCLALNIPDFNRKPPERGDILCQPGYLRAATIFHLRITPVPGLKKPLRNSEEVKFHTGTIEQSGKLYLLGEEKFSQRGELLGTVVMNEAIAAAPGDRFIIRRPTPAATVAGGEIAAVSEGAARPRKAELLVSLQSRFAFFEGCPPEGEEMLERQVEYFLITEKKTGASLRETSIGLLLPEDVIRELLPRLIEKNRIIPLSPDFFIHVDSYRSCINDFATRIRRAVDEQGALSLTDAELRQGFPWNDALWTRIEEEPSIKDLIHRRGSRFILSAPSAQLQNSEQETLERILRIYEETGFESPRPDELQQKLNLPSDKTEKLMEFLCNAGRLLRLERRVILSYSCFKRAEEEVVMLILEKGSLNSGDFKYILGSSRKYALAILDYLDSIGVTIRIGNDRKLAPDYQKKLI
jgi:selenocysteine-specific elongation factor